MLTILLRIALGAGLLAIPFASAQGDDQLEDDPLPEPVQAAELGVPAARGLVNPGQQYGIRNTGPNWTPGENYERGTQNGSPYYWSHQGSRSPYGQWAPDSPGIGNNYGYRCGCNPRSTNRRWDWGNSQGWDGSQNWGGSTASADSYSFHFWPGYHRNQDFGHFRFSYYSYRRPWYFPGNNRDTNYPW